MTIFISECCIQMKQSGKKYVLKESELKEIVREMLLSELYNPADYQGLYTQNYKGSVPNVGNYLNAIKGMAGGLANAVIPDSWKDAAANGGRDLPQWLLDVLGAQKAGTSGPDFVPDWWNSKRLGGTGAGLDFGANADAHQTLNVGAACQYIRSIARNTPGRHCAKNVRKALNHGGLGLPHGKPAGSAKNYLTILPENGWTEINQQNAGEPGDVLVVAPCVDSAGSSHPYGHIAMCVGNGVWISDYIQSTVHGLKGTPPRGTMHFYRYNNRV